MSARPLASSVALWLSWVLIDAVGVLLGLGTILLLAAISGVADRDQGPLRLAALSALGGAALGGVQLAVLVRVRPEVRPARWIVATAIGAALGSGLVLLATAHIGRELTAVLGPTRFLGLALSVPVGAVVGSAIGLCQARELPGVGRFLGWVAGSALGWALAVPLVVTACEHAAALSWWAATLEIGVALLGAGALLGAAQGYPLASATAWQAGCTRTEHVDLHRS